MLTGLVGEKPVHSYYLHKTFDFTYNLNIIIYHLFEGPLSRTTKK